MFYTIFSTKLGWMGLLGSERGLKRLILPSQSSEIVKKELQTTSKDLSVNDDYFKDVVRQLRDYVQGAIVDFDCKLDLSGTTDFQRGVWFIAAGIPRGEIRSYKWVANQLGNYRAFRAVGQALARNPIPVIIPCHRVIYGHGRLGGFGGKRNIASMKEMLLFLEGVKIRRNSAAHARELIRS